MKSDYDIIIIGNGIVGASVACALAALNLSIAIIDQKSMGKTAISADNEADGRKIALSFGSYKILQHLQIWPRLSKHTTPIKQVHISKKGSFASTRLHAKDINAEFLGYVVPAEILLQTLNNATISYSNIIHFCPATLLDINATVPSVKIKFNKKIKTITAKLIIAADGALSYSRNLLKLPVTEKDYQQTALVTSVKIKNDCTNIAYQRLIGDAVMALLPMQKQTYCIVYTGSNNTVNNLMALDEKSLCDFLQQKFGYRLGRFNHLGPRFTYPLKLIIATKQIFEHVLLIGNAAHNISPVAAQGFNLALQDIYCLQQLCKKFPQDYLHVLEDYQRQRLPEQQRIIKFTDHLMTWSKNKSLAVLQSLGLFLFDLSPTLKQQLITLNMGLTPPVQLLTRSIDAK